MSQNEAEIRLSSLPGIAAGIEHLTATDPDFAGVLDRYGPLRLELKPGGFGGMVRIMLGQQVSVLAADAIWQKLRYLKELANDILSGRIDLDAIAGMEDYEIEILD